MRNDRALPAEREPGRLHLVFVPGFGGFDALGDLEYYAGTVRGGLVGHLQLLRECAAR